jgi:hypothetical protein
MVGSCAFQVEKMLQLVKLVEEILKYVVRDMTAPCKSIAEVNEVSSACSPTVYAIYIQIHKRLIFRLDRISRGVYVRSIGHMCNDCRQHMWCACRR